MINKFRHAHPMDRLCQLMDVAKRGDQTWRCGKVISARQLEEARLVAAIRAAYQRGPRDSQTERMTLGDTGT